MSPELTGPQIVGIILAVVTLSGLAVAWAFRDEETSSSLRESVYKRARKIIISRIEKGTQLTSQLLEDNGWIYRDGYFIDPRASDAKRVHIKFIGKIITGVHYYKVYHCVRIKKWDKGEAVEIANADELTLFATESTVEWLETHLLTINKKPEKLI